MKFEGFTEADFDAYAENKWRSNRFNLERMRTREKLVGLQEQLQPAPEGESPSLESGWSHDHPTVFNNKRVSSQWCYRLRDEESRKILTGSLTRSSSMKEQVEDPALHHLHALLGLEINQTELRIGLSVHQNASVDLENWKKACGDQESFSGLKSLIEALPDSLEVSVGDDRVDAPTWKAWTAEDWALKIGQVQEGKAPWIHLARWIPREDVLAWESDEWKNLAEWMTPLATLHHQLQWSEEHDRLDLQSAIAEEKAARQAAKEATEVAKSVALEKATKEESKEESHGPRGAISVLGDWRKTRRGPRPSSGGDERPQKSPHEDRTPENRGDKPRESRGDRPRENRGDRPRENRRDEGSRRRNTKPSREGRDGANRKRGEHRDSRNRKHSGGRGRDESRGGRSTNRQPRREEKKWVEAAGTVSVGSRVRLKEGLLAGRDGNVVELSSKGEAKVLVGQFPTRVSVKTLTLLQEG